MTTVHPSIPLIAGEPLAAGDTCYIAFRGPWSWRVYRWAHHDLEPLPEPVGVASRDYLTGDTVTLLTDIHIGAGQTEVHFRSQP